MFAGTQSKLDYARPHMTLNGLQAGEIMRRQIKPATLAVFVALYSHCRADWVCFPSRKRMAAMTGLSDRAVTSALGDLVKMEWIRRVGATPAGVLRYQLTAPSVPVGAGTVLPPPLEVSFPLKEEGRESKALLEEEGGPSVVLPSTQDWEEFSAFWPGPQTKEAGEGHSSAGGVLPRVPEGPRPHDPDPRWCPRSKLLKAGGPEPEGHAGNR